MAQDCAEQQRGGGDQQQGRCHWLPGRDRDTTRQRDAEWVRDVEEILRLEIDQQPPSKVVPTKKK